MKTRFSCVMNSESPYVDNKLKKVRVQSTCKIKKMKITFIYKNHLEEKRTLEGILLLLVDFL